LLPAGHRNMIRKCFNEEVKASNKNWKVNRSAVCFLYNILFLCYFYNRSLYCFNLLFSLSGSPTILVFSHQTGWQYSNGNSPNGGVKCIVGIKNHDFQPISRFISELMQDKSHNYYGRRIGNCTQAFELYQFE